MHPSSDDWDNYLYFDFVLITLSYGLDSHASLSQKENELVR